MPKKILVILLIVLGTLGYTYYYWQNQQSPVTIDSYDSCVAAKGSRIQESYPATCVTKSGARFIQPLTDEQQQNLIPSTSSY